mgnify:CR=1 FL=1
MRKFSYLLLGAVVLGGLLPLEAEARNDGISFKPWRQGVLRNAEPEEGKERLLCEAGPEASAQGLLCKTTC